MTEALYESQYAWMKAGGQGPSKIYLRTNEYVRLAHELGIRQEHGAIRIVYEQDVISFAATEPVEPAPKMYLLDEIKLGPTFIWNGPAGRVTIIEDTDDEK